MAQGLLLEWETGSSLPGLCTALAPHPQSLTRNTSEGFGRPW